MNSLLKKKDEIVSDEHGAIGYLVAWLLGVPASVLLLIILFRGL